MKVTNYRPVSVLCVMSKVLERLMYNRLLNFVEKFNILYDLQFGFRKEHSTFMALMVVVDKIIKSLQNGEFTIGLYLDFSKAFDTIDHEILFMKLYHYGIRGVSLSWFKSYMSNRSQFVSYNGDVSATRRIKCGVPQGSILGPLLFLLYVNDLASVSEFLKSALFADDTNMFASNSDLAYLEKRFNEEIKNVALWLQVNKLSLNIEKSHFMIFSGGRHVNPISLEINGIQLSQVNDVKFLGIMMDDKLTWKKHIEHISNKIAKSIGIMYRLKPFVNKETLLSLYYTLVYPYLTYCCIIWGNTCTTYLQPLRILQKRVIRMLSNVRSKEHTAPLFNQLGILNIDKLYSFTVCQFMFKYHKGDLLDVFNDMFSYNCNIHDHNTRMSTGIHIPVIRLNIAKRFIRYSGAILWNRIIGKIYINRTIYTFKRQLKRFLLDS